MQRAFRTIDNIVLNEKNISMFRVFHESGKHGIELVADYQHDTPYILMLGSQAEQKEYLDKLGDMLSYSDWGRTQDGSIFRIDHIKYSKTYEQDGVFCLDISFSGGEIFPLFRGTEDGLYSAEKEFRRLCYAVIYDMEKM